MYILLIVIVLWTCYENLHDVEKSITLVNLKKTPEQVGQTNNWKPLVSP